MSAKQRRISGGHRREATWSPGTGRSGNAGRGRAARPRPTHGRGEEGFALVLVLLALVGMTSMAMAGHVLSRTDLQLSRNHEAHTMAFYAADAGLRQYIGTQRGVPDASVSYAFDDGAATVTATPLLDGFGYRLTSDGTHTTAAGGMGIASVRTVAVLGPLYMPAAFTSGVGILKNGSSGEISGYDAATSSDCALAGRDVAGVAVPPGGYTQTDGSSVPQGDPDIRHEEPIALLRSLGLEWSEIVDGTSAVPPDYAIPGDGWPNFASLGPEEWPIIYVDDPLFVVDNSRSGQGALLVRGDLVMNGSFEWDGALLVGGSITSNGNQTIEGVTVSGLNLLLGEPVLDNVIANGTKTFQFDSCKAADALRSLAWLIEKPGTWSESL